MILSVVRLLITNRPVLHLSGAYLRRNEKNKSLLKKNAIEKLITMLRAVHLLWKTVPFVKNEFN